MWERLSAAARSAPPPVTLEISRRLASEDVRCSMSEPGRGRASLPLAVSGHDLTAVESEFRKVVWPGGKELTKAPDRPRDLEYEEFSRHVAAELESGVSQSLQTLRSLRPVIPFARPPGHLVWGQPWRRATRMGDPSHRKRQ